MNDYTTARQDAQAKADATGFDYGLENLRLAGRDNWHVFMLPQKKNRFGHEARCEVVSPMDLTKCKPGHGPMAR